MLQEILLSLSGIPSPIWDNLKSSDHDGQNAQDYISAPEQAMLVELSRLSQLHIDVKSHAAAISSRHPSPVCRAISSAITHKHLAAFRQKVIEVESSILKGDATHVGGYNIVPLSTLVADFVPWTRRLTWLEKVTLFMRGSKTSRSYAGCTAASILDFLDNERHTGFADLEDVVVHLLVVAQKTWMRSVSSWVLYGHLPSFGGEDFFIGPQSGKELYEHCVINRQMIPKVISSLTAENILAIGNALRQIGSPDSHDRATVSRDAAAPLLRSHLDQLNLLQYPLNPALIESTMGVINSSISQHALSHLLPQAKVVEFCKMLQEYVLLGRGEFAIALIENCDARVAARQKLRSSTKPVRKLGRIDDMLVKQSELDGILSKTWTDLMAWEGQSELEDDILETARQYIKFAATQETADKQAQPSLSTLLPTSTSLYMHVPPGSAFGMFLSPSSIEEYSRISSYLLSLKRSHMRLSSLWKLTTHRRCHPTPLGPPMSTTDFGRRACKLRRDRETTRNKQMRRFWSSMNKAHFWLHEFSSYLYSEIIANHWKHFETWLEVNRLEEESSDTSDPQASIANQSQVPSTQNAATFKLKRSTQGSVSTDDPRVLAGAHSAYLAALTSALLINDAPLIATIKSFLNLIDHFVALFNRLSTVWQGLDLQEDDGVVDAFTNYVQDEKDIRSEMDRARNELEQTLEQLVKNIKDSERAQNTSDVTGGIASVGLVQDAQGRFTPWKARTLDRLIMKLDFLYTEEEGTEDLVDGLEYD